MNLYLDTYKNINLMKKNYILAFLVLCFAWSIKAQIVIEDDFEGYDLGPLSEQANHWRTWSGTEGGPEEAIVTSDESSSGSQSARWDEGEGPQDVIFLSGDQTTGTYVITWMFYIPSNASGYFNIQGEISTPQVGDWISGNISFNFDGLTPGMGSEDSTGATFSFPHDFWFPVKVFVDVDAMTYEVTINGTLIHTSQTPWGNASGINTLGGINFYARDAANTFYVDDILLLDGHLNTDEFSASLFSIYPNPVKNMLNIRSKTAVNTITIYDLLGKVVLTASPDMISPSIDMSDLSSGTYLVNLKIGNTSKTVKVIK